MPTVESNVHLTISSLKERLHFEEFISELFTRFVNLSPNELDNWIDHDLKQVVEFLGVGRSSLLQISGDEEVLVFIMRNFFDVLMAVHTFKATVD